MTAPGKGAEGSAWRSDQKLDARNYSDANERKAFRAGYSDGYHGAAMWAGNERNWYPNAYSAGYWEGVGDKPAAG